MLAGFVQETANNPGNSTTVSLAGAVTGRRRFFPVFGLNSFFYFMDDGNQAEWGYGTVTAGHVLSRTTVLGNTSGTTAKLNFTGLVRIYNDFVAERALYRDTTGATAVPGSLTVTGLSTFVGGSVATGSASVEAAGLGKVKLINGDSTRPGYVSFHSADDTRRGFLGWSNSLTGGSERLQFLTENGWGLEFTIASPKQFKVTATDIVLVGVGSITGNFTSTGGDIKLGTLGTKFYLYDIAANNAAYLRANGAGDAEIWTGAGVTVAARVTVSGSTGTVTVAGTLTAAALQVSGNSVLHTGIARTAVGAYVLALYNGGAGGTTAVNAGGTTSGANLTPCATGQNTGGAVLSGTWECLGYGSTANFDPVSLWRRIS